MRRSSTSRFSKAANRVLCLSFRLEMPFSLDERHGRECLNEEIIVVESRREGVISKTRLEAQDPLM